MSYEFHPAANLFPLMQGDEFKELVADIREHGLIEPIWLLDGKILDGRNRYRACIEANEEPRFEDFVGGDPVDFVVSLNLKRRHLNESQRAMVAAKVANIQKGEVGGGHEKAEGQICTSDAAEMLNVSERTVKSARKVQDKGALEVVEAVEQGKVSVSAASEIVKEPLEEQVKIIARTPEEIVKEANRIKREKKVANKAKREAETAEKAKSIPKDAKMYRIIQSGIGQLDIEPESVDFVITDPPYPEEFLETFGILARRSAEWLKPGGSLLCMSGQAHLPDVVRLLTDAGLRYQWTLGYMTPGGQAVQVFPRKVNTFWKPVFWFVNGDYPGQWVGDVVKSDVNANDKNHHHWGQSESGMADLIKRFTQPGDTILDPFCGGGTTGVVAIRMKRFFIGADVDEKAVATTLTRLAEVQDAELVA